MRVEKQVSGNLQRLTFEEVPQLTHPMQGRSCVESAFVSLILRHLSPRVMAPYLLEGILITFEFDHYQAAIKVLVYGF